MILDAQGMGNPVLDLAGVLGAGVNQPLALLLWAGIGDLTLEIKMLLAANREVTLKDIGGLFYFFLRITARDMYWRKYKILLLNCLPYIQHRRPLIY
jgi:hypothetical protein